MPRKTKGLAFEVHPGPKKNEKGETMLYATTESGRKMSLDDFELWIHDKYSLPRGMMTRVFEAFMEAAPEWMAQGYKIETPIGIFSPRLKMKRDITNPDEVGNTDVEVDGVDCRISKQFEKRMGHSVNTDGYRYVRKTASSKILNDTQRLEEALYKSLKANKGFTTVSSFMQFSGLTKYSADKQLTHWCHGENPKLQRTRINHNDIFTEI